MSLNWDTTKCKDISDEEWKDYHYIMCTILMATYIPEINDKNLPELYARMKFLEHEIGGWYSYFDDKGERIQGEITIEKLETWKGLSINQTYMTRTQWVNLQKKRIVEDLNRYVRNYNHSKKEEK